MPRRSREGGNPGNAAIGMPWVPAYAGTTTNHSTILRSQSGSGHDFCAGKSIHTVVAPPAA